MPKTPTEKGARTTKTTLKLETTQVKSQGDSTFPADSHKAILKKMKNKSKTKQKADEHWKLE